MKIVCSLLIIGVILLFAAYLKKRTKRDDVLFSSKPRFSLLPPQ